MTPSQREKLTKLRDEMEHAYRTDSRPGTIGVSRDWFPAWLAVLSSILSEPDAERDTILEVASEVERIQFSWNLGDSRRESVKALAARLRALVASREKGPN